MRLSRLFAEVGGKLGCSGHFGKKIPRMMY